MAKLYWIVVKDKTTGQELHRSDFFDNSEDALRWARDCYGDSYYPDLGPNEYWKLESRDETVEDVIKVITEGSL